jgi:hypothetical protein
MGEAELGVAYEEVDMPWEVKSHNSPHSPRAISRTNGRDHELVCFGNPNPGEVAIQMPADYIAAGPCFQFLSVNVAR